MNRRKTMLALLLAAALLLCCGCSAKVEGEASVQSVAMLCGLGATGRVDRYAGVVSARSETNIQRDETKVIDEILVAEGDNVSAGQVLFTYDMEQAELSLEKGKLELEQMRNTVAAKEKEKAELEKSRDKAGSSEQLSYTLAIQEVDTAIREANYNIALKEKEVSKLEESLGSLDVCSPVDGRVQQLNPDYSYDNYGNPLPFLSIMETGTYRVKGYVNEQNLQDVYEGVRVLVRSRLDSEAVWNGTISMIDWENPSSSNGANGVYYYETAVGGEGEVTGSNNYPFYIELDDATGLLLGQHVFIEPDYGQEAEPDDNALHLPAYFLNDTDGAAWVWAENSRGLLEKRSVTLGEYDEMTDTWVITQGLDGSDYIAFPEESLQAGMTCVEFDETAFETDPGFFEPIPMDGEVFEELPMDGGDFEAIPMNGEVFEELPAVEEEAVG